MSVCFTGIVKNETRVIERCIDSTMGVIDRYCVVDTGSTDGTQELIRAHMRKRGIKGCVIQSEWRGFGESRNEALHHAREQGADYLLMMDADHTLAVESWPNLSSDIYQVRHHYAELRYTLPILQRCDIKAHYEMPVHEFLVPEQPVKHATLEGARIEVHTDGARSTNPKKYDGDIELLTKFCAENPSHARGQYYLAQSYRDAGRVQEASEAYLKRAQMDGFDQETWSAVYEAGKCIERMGKNPLTFYLDAYAYRPSRAEPLWALARWLRLNGKIQLSYLFARRAFEIPMPNDILFVEHNVYTWMAPDECAVAAFHAGDMELARRAANAIRFDAINTEQDKARVLQNRTWYGL